MLSEIPITTLNDFTFCPRSIYFHGIYSNFSDTHYKGKYQKRGTLKHESSDTATYSSQKKYLQGMEVASSEYGLVGKIDIYDKEEKLLIERKAKITTLYPGYVLQLCGQIVCLEEMGFPVHKTLFHSLLDNKRYPYEIGEKDWEYFFETLEAIRSFDISQSKPIENTKKCSLCIYKSLCRN